MRKLKDAAQRALCKIRNPEYSQNEEEFKRSLGAKRLLFLLPFFAVAAIFILLSLE